MTEPRPSSAGKPGRRARRCPICRAPTAAEWRPFCSRRCADADLGNWLAGNYRIASTKDEGEAGEADSDDDAVGQ